MAATTAGPKKGENSLLASSRTSKPRATAAKIGGRGKKRNEVKSDGEVVITPEINGRNAKRREGSPKTESPPKKARHQSKWVAPEKEEKSVQSGEKPTNRVPRTRDTTEGELPIRNKNANKKLSQEEPGKPGSADKSKTTKKKNTAALYAPSELPTTSKKRQLRQRKESQEYTSDGSLPDDFDEDYAFREKKRLKHSHEKELGRLKSEAFGSSAEADPKIKKKQGSKQSKKSSQLKKVFTKPRRPNQYKEIALVSNVTKNASPGPFGVASLEHEQRLLHLARQMDGSEDDLYESAHGQKIPQMSDPSKICTEDTKSEEAHRALIMRMLKEHEEVAEMSDTSDDDDEHTNAGVKLNKVFSKSDKAKLLSSVAGNSKEKNGLGSEPSGKLKHRKPPDKKSATKKKKQQPRTQANDHESSSCDEEDEGDWEVVDNASARDPNYQRPDNVTVILKNDDFIPDAKRLDMEQRMMRLINRRRKVVQNLGHNTHLLCLLAYQRYINSIIQDDTLRALALSRMPADLVLQSPLPASGADSHFVKSLLLFCSRAFELTEPTGDGESFSIKSLKEKLRVLIMNRMTSCNVVYLLGIVLIMRSMGVPTRLCFSHRPMTHKPALLRRKNGEIAEFTSKTDLLGEPLGVLDYFAEVYVGDRRCWRPMDTEEHRIIEDPQEMGAHLDQPVLYVVSIDAKNAMMDLTPKYHNNWLSKGAKLRPKSAFLEKTLAYYAPADDTEDHIEEQKEVANLQEKRGLPKFISEYKNHPKYVLARHLLKFEAIYPRDAEILGYVNKEPVYRRECVKLLRSKDTWHRHGRQVKEGEIAYNVVKARPKWDRRNEVMIKDLPLEVFGEWQTEPYTPPVAKDGKVPRNAFGNVELFHDDMLPVGTVHLKLPGLNRIADELGIDCVPAVVGFEGVARGCHPVIEGFVVCVEHQEILEAAWYERQTEDRRKRRERIRKRALKNWRKIIQKVIWDSRLKKKYSGNL